MVKNISYKAPIHCRGSIGEASDVMLPNLFPWRNKLIYILGSWELNIFIFGRTIPLIVHTFAKHCDWVYLLFACLVWGELCIFLLSVVNRYRTGIWHTPLSPVRKLQRHLSQTIASAFLWSSIYHHNKCVCESLSALVSVYDLWSQQMLIFSLRS